MFSIFLNFKSWIKLIYDTVDVCNFVINEFNPTFEVQNMGNEAFQNASFGGTPKGTNTEWNSEPLKILKKLRVLSRNWTYDFKKDRNNLSYDRILNF